MFSVHFPERRIPSKSTIRAVVDSFNRGVLDPSMIKVKKPNQALSLHLQMEICQAVVDNRNISLSEISKIYDVSTSAACRLLHREKFYPYKVSCHQEIFTKDTTRRMDFCDEIQQLLGKDENLLENIIFSDECTFNIGHAPNRQNTRFWMNKNPHEVVENRTQYKISVCGLALLETQLLGLFFIENRLNAQVYYELMEEQVLPFIRELPNHVS